MVKKKKRNLLIPGIILIIVIIFMSRQTTFEGTLIEQDCNTLRADLGIAITGWIAGGSRNALGTAISNWVNCLNGRRVIIFNEIENTYDFTDTCIVGDCTAQAKRYTWCFNGKTQFDITSESCDSPYNLDPGFGAYPSLNMIYYDVATIYFLTNTKEELQTVSEFIENPYPNSINLRLIYSYNDLVSYDSNWLSKIDSQYNVLKNALSQYNINLIDVQFISQYITDTSKLPDEFILKRDIEPYPYTDTLNREIGTYSSSAKDIDMYFVTNSRYNRPFLTDIDNPSWVLAHEIGHILWCIHPGSLGSLTSHIYDTNNIMGFSLGITIPKYKSDCHIILTQFYS